MKQIFILIILAFSFGTFSCQTERYIYETQVNPDTINLVSILHERTFLDIRKDHSIFISENKLLKDSLISVFRKQQESLPESDTKRKRGKLDFPKLADGKTLQPGFFDFFIEKNVKNKEVSLIENVGSKQIYYLEDRNINWKISEDFMDLNGQKTQKATTNFGGRTWTAWFATDIKISDGPYKFYGLPGLILKLDDSSGDYKFTFLKKINIPDSFSEEILPTSKKSTRIDFIGDKAAMKLEFAQNNRKNSGENPDFSNFGKRGGRRGGIRSKGMGGEMDSGDRNAGGLSRMDDEEDDYDNEAPNMNKGNFSGFSGQRNGFGGESQTGNPMNNNGNYRSISQRNPIELK